MSDSVVRFMGISLPRPEAVSLFVVGLVLVAYLVAIALALVEGRRKAKREAGSDRSRRDDSQMVI
jgi:hypothetical protein